MNLAALLAALVAGAAAGVYIGRASVQLVTPPDGDVPGLGKSGHVLDLVDDEPPYYGPVRRIPAAYDWERDA